jgi:signal transduction histidine kinase
MTCTADRRENAPQQHGRRATATQERLDRALLVLHQQQTAVAVAAHDMKNNLTVIRTAAQLVERQMRRAAGPEPEHVLSLVTTIQSGATKLQQLVDDFLDLARLQSGYRSPRSPSRIALRPSLHADAGAYRRSWSSALGVRAAVSRSRVG